MGPASGYEIRKAFEAGPFSHFAEGGFSAIYPALGKLTEEALVTCTVETQEKRPDKKIYELTADGRKHLIAALSAKMPGEDKFKSDFLFTLFFAEEMPRDFVTEAIDARIEWYRNKVEQLKACEGNPSKGRHFVRLFGIDVYQTEHDFLVRHRQDFINLTENPGKNDIPASARAAE